MLNVNEELDIESEGVPLSKEDYIELGEMVSRWDKELLKQEAKDSRPSQEELNKLEVFKNWLAEDEEKTNEDNKSYIEGFTKEEVAVLERFGDDVLKPIGNSAGYMILNISLEQVEDGLKQFGLMDDKNQEYTESDIIINLELAMNKDTNKLIEIFKDVIGESKFEDIPAAISTEMLLELIENSEI